MICRNCRNLIQDNARFCPHCGAQNSPGPGEGLPQGAAPYGTPAAPAWEAPEGGGKKKKTGLFIGVGVAVMAVIALVAVLAGGLFSNPKKQVEAAFVKSAAAYKAAEEKLALPDTKQWQKDQAVAQRMALELKSINSQLVGYDLSALNGLGLYMSTDYDGKARKMSFDIGARWGEDDLVSFRMAADDAELYFSSPQLAGETYYGVNTETLGEDVAKLTGDDSVKDLSFNLFKLVDMMLERVDQEAMERAFKEANKTLWEQAEVKKTGAKTIDLNGTETKTTAYRVTFPQEALDRYADDLTDILSSMDYYSLYEELYQSMGMPQEQIDEIMSALEEIDVYGSLADSLHDEAAKMGSLELDVCLSGGYLSAALYEGQISGVDVALALYLGGGSEYVDDLSAEVKVNSTEVTVKSAGDHGLKGGTYTDETTVQVRQLGASVAKVVSELSIDPGKKADNFQWKLGVESSGLSVFALETDGKLFISSGKDGLSLDLKEVSVRTMGVEVCTLGFSYYVDCHPAPASAENSKLLTQMNELELMMTALAVQEKATSWVSDMEALFASRLPAELLYSLF